MHVYWLLWYHADMSLVNDSGELAHTQAQARTRWTFLTNHAHVLIALARDSEMRVRDMATLVGITERAVHQILTDLEEAGVLRRVRDGRRNRYEVDTDIKLRHPMEAGHRVAELLELGR